MSRTLVPLLVLATLIGEAPIARVVGQEPELLHGTIVECAIIMRWIVERIGAIYGALGAGREHSVPLIRFIGPLADFSAQLFMRGGEIGAEGEYHSISDDSHSAALTCFNHISIMEMEFGSVNINRYLYLVDSFRPLGANGG